MKVATVSMRDTRLALWLGAGTHPPVGPYIYIRPTSPNGYGVFWEVYPELLTERRT